MTAGYIGNRHPGLGCLLHEGHLLLCGIPAPALNPGKHFDSISTVRHSRKTRLKPSSYLNDGVRLNWGLLHLRDHRRKELSKVHPCALVAIAIACSCLFGLFQPQDGMVHHSYFARW